MNKSKLRKEDLVGLHGDEYVAKFEGNRSIYELRLKGILNNIKLSKEAIVADYGCGNGQLFEHIHNLVKGYYGVDFSASFIEAFKKRLTENEFAIQPNLYCEDIIEFVKNHPQEFDIAFTLDFSEHIYDEDFLIIYKAIYESLKPGGSLVLHTPNANFFLEWMRNHGWIKQRNEHIAVRNGNQYALLLNKIGFKKVEILHIPHYNILKHLNVLSYLPIIGGAFKARLLIKCIK